jgi:GT2 family glycosyltransferase
LIATYRRPRELERLLDSLAGEELSAAIVVDNEGNGEVRMLVEKTGPWAHYVDPGANLGCGGGLRLAEERALELAGSTLTHLLILDDDAVLAPGTVGALAEALEKELASLAYPLITANGGQVGWLPGLAERTRGLRDTFEGTPEDFRAQFGSAPRDVVWAQGICLLVTVAEVKRWGLHRDDFWVRGEDLEFSLRLTAHERGIFVPTVVVQHLPPPETAPLSREAEYLKHCALVQNMAFIGFRLRHGRRIAWTVPGALRRFFRVWSWAAMSDALRALWRGAVLGQPAGAGASAEPTSAHPARTFRERFAALPSHTAVSS